MMINRPKKVKIGPHWIAIFFTHTVLNDGESVFGFYDNTKSKISISTDQSNSMQADTLLHEIIHAIHYLCLAISIKKDNVDIEEEILTTLTATSLCQVFKDNPKVINWILEMLNAN